MRQHRLKPLLRTRIAERWPWRRRGHPCQAAYDPEDYEAVMLERLHAGLPVGTRADWDRPDPQWPDV